MGILLFNKLNWFRSCQLTISIHQVTKANIPHREVTITTTAKTIVEVVATMANNKIEDSSVVLPEVFLAALPVTKPVVKITAH